MASLIRSLLRRVVRSEEGAELIEFALTLPLMLLIVIGIMEFGFVFQQYEVVTNAAREGARIAALQTYGATAGTRVSNASARVNQYLTASGLNPSLATTCVGVSPGCAGATVVESLGGTPAVCVTTIPVRVEYPHPVPMLSGIVSYFGGTFGDITLRATSRMRTEASAGTCP